MNYSFSKTRYNLVILNITLTGLLLTITTLIAFVSSFFIPPIPILNGRLDFWYIILILSFIIIPQVRFKIIYLVSLSFVLYFLEGAGYAGPGDFILEICVPFVALFALVFISSIKTIKFKIALIILTVFLFTLIRTLTISYAGVVFYNVTWEASLIFNSFNILVDGLLMLLVTPFLYFKLRNINFVG